MSNPPSSRCNCLKNYWCHKWLKKQLRSWGKKKKNGKQNQPRRLYLLKIFQTWTLRYFHHFLNLVKKPLPVLHCFPSYETLPYQKYSFWSSSLFSPVPDVAMSQGFFYVQKYLTKHIFAFSGETVGINLDCIVLCNTGSQCLESSTGRQNLSRGCLVAFLGKCFFSNSKKSFK